LAQPAVQSPGVGAKGRQSVVKSGAVIFDLGMDQLMQKYQVKQVVGQQGEFEIEAQIVVCRAAAPAAFLVAKIQFPIGKVMCGRKLAQPSRDFCSGLVRVETVGGDRQTGD